MKRPRNSKQSRTPRKSILIYCDGETEKNYATSLKQDRYRSSPIKIEPLLESKGYKHVFNYLRNIQRRGEDDFYHCILYVLDMDTVYRDGHIDHYNNEKTKLVKSFKGGHLYIIESRPCIEFWFILHYSPDDRLLNSYEEAKSILCKYIPDYEKTNVFTQRVYSILKENLSKAIRYSKDNQQRHESEEIKYAYSYTHMHKLIEVLDFYNASSPIED